MNQERKEELIVRWVDREPLSAEEQDELNRIFEVEPELKTMREEHGRVKAGLQSAFGAPEDVPYGDFFQTKLEQAIRDADRDERPAAKPVASWRDTLRWWLAPVTVGAMAVAFLAGTRVGSPAEEKREMVKKEQERPLVYTPEGGVTSTIVNTDADGTSVIVLDGLPPIPDSFDLMAERAPQEAIRTDVRLISAKSSSQVY